MARKLILIIFALLIAGSTVWFVKNWAGGQKQIVEKVVVQQVANSQVEPKKPTVKILVAASNLPAGTLVRDEHMAWQAWPEIDGMEEIYFVENDRSSEELLGTVVRQGISAGEPISEGRLVKPGQSGFLAAVLEPESRAISIEVDATSGIAGFVFPGDRIDLILTLQVNKDVAGPGSRRSRKETTQKTHHVSETILTDVRVVAMDQSTDDQTQEASVRRIATLEVSPKEVEIVSVSRELGRLSLSLRSIARNEDMDNSEGTQTVLKQERGRGYTWDSEASSIIAAPSSSMEAAKTVNVVRAGKVKQKSFW